MFAKKQKQSVTQPVTVAEFNAEIERVQGDIARMETRATELKSEIGQDYGSSPATRELGELPVRIEAAQRYIAALLTNRTVAQRGELLAELEAISRQRVEAAQRLQKAEKKLVADFEKLRSGYSKIYFPATQEFEQLERSISSLRARCEQAGISAGEILAIEENFPWYYESLVLVRPALEAAVLFVQPV